MGLLCARASLQVESDIASEFGELVSDPETSEILHYAEKPETFVSGAGPAMHYLMPDRDKGSFAHCCITAWPLVSQCVAAANPYFPTP